MVRGPYVSCVRILAIRRVHSGSAAEGQDQVRTAGTGWSHWRRYRPQVALPAGPKIMRREGRGLAWLSAGSGAVSSPRPSNRACGSPAHGLPTFFTAGVRPARARAGTVRG
jgi:hypothetical protein